MTQPSELPPLGNIQLFRRKRLKKEKREKREITPSHDYQTKMTVVCAQTPGALHDQRQVFLRAYRYRHEAKIYFSFEKF